MKTAFLSRDGCPFIGKVFDDAARGRIAKLSALLPVVLTPANFDGHRADARDIEVLFGTWGIPPDLLADPANFPSLKAVFYSAGSVKGFARPLLERGVTVVGARAANGVSVAQFCLAQIILAGRGYFRNTRDCRHPETSQMHTAFIGAGLYKETVALLGMGAVARELVRLLRHLTVKIIAVDPYLKPAEATELGVTQVTMEEAFAQGYVVSNHLPDLAPLKGVLNERHFASMRPNATFINTGRGGQIHEGDLIQVFRRRTDLTALLDVTAPEPPEPGSPLYELPNVQLSSHIAGAFNDEVRRMGDFIVDEFAGYVEGRPLLHADTLEMLDRLA